MGNKISILIPVYNEEKTLHMLYERLKRVSEKMDYDFEFLFINDGSKDRSLDIMRELRQKDSRVSYLNLSRNYGKEIAMAAGFDYVVGDAIIIMDADLQDPPELIPRMVSYWEEGYDDVYAKRRNRAGESWFKKKTSYWFYRILKKLSKIEIQEDTGDFRLLSRRAVEAIKKIKEHHRYTKGFFSWIGFNKKEILFDREPRAAGKTKWNYYKLLELAVEGIISFSAAPLRISTVIGFMIAMFSFIYMIYVIMKTLLFGDPVAGYPSLVSLILFLSGIQFIILGVIGEYLGRVFNETKNRPLYFAEEYNNKKIM
ncbi:glycosyltransferase family 2 protein [Paramaledivibacter caminithermalis]|jgi:glycosyltransferase involved in cell wall biosynthesis|uniref:Glycosyltransferase involved in cell wall bisynthesis n=1 Tax=Paramaledivibacter caminithermalis (strain DSM 15212 / CIP 107654 / DViRD3) TaxID=1121301 RepID=A0A1M6MSK8_PARC5|nr:glycosyltransferase family 2 protein [Paramaledivibacter caminithermalis]SHJ86488.1 Glycosyltransferase involved in cell wall bisynthesis [Paramaledivibacter caminithermalis DSM 15212]